VKLKSTFSTSCSPGGSDGEGGDRSGGGRKGGGGDGGGNGGLGGSSGGEGGSDGGGAAAKFHQLSPESVDTSTPFRVLAKSVDMSDDAAKSMIAPLRETALQLLAEEASCEIQRDDAPVIPAPFEPSLEMNRTNHWDNPTPFKTCHELPLSLE
jgi:hypothetical protein